MNYSIKQFLLLVLSFFVITTACDSPITQKADTSVKQSEIASQCRVVQHELGKTCIPLKPQRIIALDIPAILDPLLALGIKPAGTAVVHGAENENWESKRYFPALLPEIVEGIEPVGTHSNPSVEKILKLQPDLILLTSLAIQSYKHLSAIAPTVPIYVWRDKVPIKENFRHIAQLVGQEEAAEKILNQYQKRVEELQVQLGDQLSGLEISVISHYSGSFWLPPNHASYFQVFKDIGLPIKPVFLKQNEWSTFSAEVMDQYDADILFIVEDVGGSSSFLSQNPLILSLKSVKDGRAYIVDPKIWDFYGPIGMNLFLDDLSQYLLEGKQDPYF